MPPRVSKRKAAEVVENALNGSPESEGERPADVVLAIRKGHRTRKIAEPKTKIKTAAKIAKTIKVSGITSTETTAIERTSAATTKTAKKVTEKAPKAAPAPKAKKAAAAAAEKKAADEERVEEVKATKGKKQREKQQEKEKEKGGLKDAEKAATVEGAKKEGSVEPLRKKSRVATKGLAGPKITSVPTQRLNIYAFGTGDNAELGLGPEVNAKVVKRPRLNAHLLPEKVGIVAVAIGGMHGLALSHEGKVYSWGVNDQYALGRETKYTPPMRDVGSDDDSDSDGEEPLNPLESTPMLVTAFPEGTIITNIAAGDSISIAVTDTGKVYGWGTFRVWDQFFIWVCNFVDLLFSAPTAFLDSMRRPVYRAFPSYCLRLRT